VPIEVEVDHERRIVFARIVGVLTDEDAFGYQRSVWSRPDVVGFDELIDVSDVEKIELPSAQRVEDLAKLGASMDPPEAKSSSKLAIVATTDFAFGLGRMYEAHRASDPRSRKEVNVFRNRADALRWLGAGAESRSGRES
jgi:hypothetical protein